LHGEPPQAPVAKAAPPPPPKPWYQRLWQRATGWLR
jgi:hypothetical protein